MAFGNYPPQAYTKDTLTRAFHWLQTQPDPVRESVKTPEALVSLFLNAQRTAQTPALSAWEQQQLGQMNSTPVNANAFKEELKILAQEFKQYEASSVAQTQSETRPTPPALQSVTDASASLTSLAKPTKIETSTSVSVQNVTSTSVSYSASVSPESLGLDERSVRGIETVREKFNLSTDIEALRLLLSLGYDRLKTLLPELPNL